MKYPKNRADIYVVTRGAAVCGSFSDFDAADDFAAACEQEFFDKTGDYSPESFRVQLSTFYG